ncbi:hypothetical protein TrLO_g10312 [Triparma laevis f. longispina]|uniref:Uncharacterized protein n=1 Tax=Triparma laevis f. longispina TaxID=1714387 RepID=A0A9W7EIR8_9STRA|nr:hypothetical protein TrLO_g10312 [Triparma laevis f. longispina]
MKLVSIALVLAPLVSGFTGPAMAPRTTLTHVKRTNFPGFEQTFDVQTSVRRSQRLVLSSSIADGENIENC